MRSALYSMRDVGKWLQRKLKVRVDEISERKNKYVPWNSPPFLYAPFQTQS